ncbi:MAG: serine hydrolase [Actinomycetaceae bacterium]|nr:beta-lactamase family protein [Arcanobacterium sp.]MDD7504556.1 serine hydrolase [Actinomycetaceae bacterium]MDY6143199.1 serine hydrolase domain-containing protein [Arcanobacterium sp.]
MHFEPLSSDTFTFDHAYIALGAGGEPRVMVGDVDREYSLASVTKPIAAYSVLIAVEQGKLGLDDDVAPLIFDGAGGFDEPAGAAFGSLASTSGASVSSSAHAREGRGSAEAASTGLVPSERAAREALEPEYLRGVTIRHLLAHASGLGASPGKPLAKPSTRRIYTNFGFDVLALALRSAIGMPIQQWIHEQVFEPLGMVDARIEGSIAKDAVSSADSLALFASELLRPTLLSQEMLSEAVAVQYPGLPGILPGFGRQDDNAWGLGFSIKGSKHPHWLGDSFSPRAFGHFGQSGSFLYVDPDAGVAGVFLGAKPFSQVHATVWPGLSNEMRELSLGSARL